jgi:hypothetical protein
VTRLLFLTRDPDRAATIGTHLETAGGLRPNLSGPLVTAIMPTLGPITISCLVCGDQGGQLDTYRHSAAIGILADATGEDQSRDLEALLSAASLSFAQHPIAVAVSVGVTTSLVGWTASVLGRPRQLTPVYRIDPANRSHLFTLVATLLCLADEAGRIE